jgi:hypothetical protein
MQTSVYLPCTSDGRIHSFYRFHRNAESVTYVLSTQVVGSTPTLGSEIVGSHPEISVNQVLDGSLFGIRTLLVPAAVAPFQIDARLAHVLKCSGPANVLTLWPGVFTESSLLILWLTKLKLGFHGIIPETLHHKARRSGRNY